MTKQYFVLLIVFAAGAISLFCMQTAMEQFAQGNQAMGALIIVSNVYATNTMLEKTSKRIRL